MLSARVAVTEHEPTLFGVITPVIELTEHAPAVTAYDRSPLPDPPTATSCSVFPKRTVEALVNEMELCVALLMVRDSVMVPW